MVFVNLFRFMVSDHFLSYYAHRFASRSGVGWTSGLIAPIFVAPRNWKHNFVSNISGPINPERKIHSNFQPSTPDDRPNLYWFKISNFCNKLVLLASSLCTLHPRYVYRYLAIFFTISQWIWKGKVFHWLIISELPVISQSFSILPEYMIQGSKVKKSTMHSKFDCNAG